MINIFRPIFCIGSLLPLSTCFVFHSSKVPALSRISKPIDSNLSPFVSSSLKASFERISYKSTRIKLSQDQNEETSPGANSSQKRRRRTRRKADSILSEEAADIDEEPKEDILIGTSSTQFVEVEVPDIRSITSGATTGAEENDSDEYEYYEDDEDSLEGLLADARRLRASKGTSEQEEDEEFNIGPAIKNIISTIVTVDFFVVLALLAWFLAGIFGSYVLKNDAVQVAFNGIFEPVVQPALGILMLASAAGGAMGGDDKD